MAESTMSLYVGQEWDDKYETRQAITNWLAGKGESWRVEKAEKNRYLVKCDHCDFRIRASLSNRTGRCAIIVTFELEPACPTELGDVILKCIRAKTKKD